MVIKLEGMIDDRNVIFERKDDGLWSATVPSNLNGMYIVELTATDEAGNVSFMTGKLYVVDAERLCIHLILDPYYAELIQDEYDIQVMQDGYVVELYTREFEHQLMRDKYTAEVIRPVCREKEGMRLEC